MGRWSWKGLFWGPPRPARIICLPGCALSKCDQAHYGESNRFPRDYMGGCKRRTWYWTFLRESAPQLAAGAMGELWSHDVSRNLCQTSRRGWGWNRRAASGEDARARRVWGWNRRAASGEDARARRVWGWNRRAASSEDARARRVWSRNRRSARKSGVSRRSAITG
jgi:hypothetical protein